MSTEAQRRSKAAAAAAIARALAHIPPTPDKSPEPATAPPIERPPVTTTTGPYQLTTARAKQIRYEIEERRRHA